MVPWVSKEARPILKGENVYGTTKTTILGR